MWERISYVYFRPRGSFSANFCSIFIAFLQPEIQSAIDRSLPTPAHQRKAPGTIDNSFLLYYLCWNQRIRFFTNSWICFTKRPCLNFVFLLFFYFLFLSRVDSLLTIGDRHWRKVAATFEKAKSANSLPFTRNGCLFMWAAYFVWVLINVMWLL